MSTILADLLAFVAQEKAVVISVVVAAIIAVAGSVGLVLDEQSVASIVTSVVVVLAGGLVTRSKVTPS